MTYYPDLSSYDFARGHPPGTKNVGWLQKGHQFEKAIPTEDTLDSLWSLCTISMMQTRGVHQCDLCETPQTVYAVRHGIRVLLGTSEIRVFSRGGDVSPLRRHLRERESGGLLFIQSSTVPFAIYAAPTLVYHYVRTHHYKPPDEFLRALSEEPRPPSPKYFERLKELNLEWRGAGSPHASPTGLRFAKTEDASPAWLTHSVHLDES